MLIGGIVIPLIATVGVNNKVQFLEKFGTSDPPNSTGAYELDLSLTDDFFHAWRELHVQSDVFCSGSLVLPDKAGRQLNVGGWSLDSTFGIRLYTPDGSPGVNGTNDWEEASNLRLQVSSKSHSKIYHVHDIYLCLEWSLVPWCHGDGQWLRFSRRRREWQ